MKLIGIAGGTCSGKTTLARGVKQRLGSDVAVLSFDEYFIGMERPDIDEIQNFEDPELYDHEQFVHDLQALRLGRALSIAARSGESTRQGIQSITIPANKTVIVEGWLTLYFPEARKLFDTTFFVDIPEDVMIARRFARSQGARRWDSPGYIQTMIIPGHRQYVMPQKPCADMVLDGTAPEQTLVRQMCSLIE